MIFFSSKTMTATGIAGVVASAGLSLWMPVTMGQEVTVIFPINVQVPFPDELPYIGDLIEAAFPTWCIDEDEQRIDIDDVFFCDDGTPNGRFSPLYFSKEFSGSYPALGGYPTNIDTQYPFEFAAPYLGQACAGSSHHCPQDFDGANENCKTCPKVETKNDYGPKGPGHIPPHITLAAVTKHFNQLGVAPNELFANAFNYDQNACRILPDVLLSIVREYFPRDEETGDVYYPPPFSEAGGAYPLEYVNLAGELCKKEVEKHSTAGALDCFEDHSGDISLYPDYLEVGHGSPHYCTKEGKEADVNDSWCPYIFFGPNRGKYRHPHIAFAAVETYLANQVMPDKCGTTWDDSNYPAAVDTTVAFPFMVGVDGFGPEQPLISDDGKWIWPGPAGTKKKPVDGIFTFDLVFADELEPIEGGDYCTDSPNTDCYKGGLPECCGNDFIECPKTPPPCECKTIAEIVCKETDLSELCNLVVRAGLADDLSSGTWTVFAPRNGGFDDLAINNFSKDQLKRLLLFHVVPNEKMYMSDLKCRGPDNLITMANGFDSRTQCKNGVPAFQKGRDNSDNSPPIIVKYDIEACNGVIHKVSEVLLHKKFLFDKFD